MALRKPTLEKLMKQQKIRRRGLAGGTRRGGRLFARLAKGLAVLLVLGALAAAGFVFHRFFISSYFELKKLVIAGVSDNVAGELRALTRLEPNKGINLLFVREERVRETVLKHPRVETVTVAKHYPNLLMIVATERQPVAIIAAGALYLVDRNGYVLDTVVSLDHNARRFPFITGLRRDQIVLGQPVPTPAALRALDLFDCLREANSPIAKMASEVRIGRDDGLTLVLSGGVEVRLGTGEFPAALAALDLFHRKHSDFSSLEYIDLRFQNQIIYRPRGGEGAGERPPDKKPWPAKQTKRES